MADGELDDLIREFRARAKERTEKITLNWISLEEKADDAVASEMLRSLHSLKGEARMLGFDTVNRIAHLAEDVALLSNELAFKVSPQVGDAMMAAADAMASYADKPPKSARVSDQAQPLLARLESLIVELDAAAPQNNGKTRQSGTATATPETIRLSSTLLESVTDISNELVLLHNRYEHLTQTLNSLHRELHEARQLRDHEGVDHAADAIGETVQILEEAVVSGSAQVKDQGRLLARARMVPIRTSLQLGVRAAREAAGRLEKPIRFEVEDRGVHLDRRMSERLEDALLHIVRNAVDHGIEDAGARMAANKPVEGTLRLEAQSRGTREVTVTVSDDGVGIDTSRLRAKALEAGWVVDERTSVDELYAILFESGFSSRDEVSDLSGRGVGLDVVKRQVESLGGRVELESAPGVGTTLRLTVPIAMSLTSALVFRVGSSTLSLPLSAVDRILVSTEHEIVSTDRGPVVEVDAERVPVTDAAPALGLCGDESPARFLVLRSRSGRFAVRVDGCLGYRELVFKPLDRALRGIDGLEGVAMLETGELAVGLDPEYFISRLDTGVHIARPAPVAVGDVKVLLVDDSPVVRGLVARTLRAQGYCVGEAGNGEEGLAHVDSDPPDVILTDIDMPVMNGLELIERLGELEDPPPIIALTSRANEEDRRRALGSGAYAYLVKTEFSSSRLVEAIARLTHHGLRLGSL